MDGFTFIIISIIIANLIGYLLFLKKGSIYLAALTVFCIAILFGGAGYLLTLVGLDLYEIYHSILIGVFLIFNSVILFLIAFSMTIVKL